MEQSTVIIIILNYHDGHGYDHNSTDCKDNQIIIGINGLVIKGPFTNFPIISCEKVWFPLDVSLHQAID